LLVCGCFSFFFLLRFMGVGVTLRFFIQFMAGFTVGDGICDVEA
jgi:hypothetical protein